MEDGRGPKRSSRADDTRETLSLTSKYLSEEGAIYLTGIQAVVRILLDQHRFDRRRGRNTAGFVSGYPGSPVGGVDLELARIRKILQQHEIVISNGLNEDIAATAVYGSQMANTVPGARFDGVFGMWFGKSPGVDRTGDAFRHANMRGVARNGGVLAVAGDDPHPKSSVLPSDSNAAFYDFNMPLLSPGDVQDVLDFGLHGYALSRASGLWIGLKVVSNIADGSGTAFVAPDRIAPIIPEIVYNGKPFEPTFRMMEMGRQLFDAEQELYYARLEMARAYSRANRLNRIFGGGRKSWLGIVTTGKSYFDLRQALDDIGLDERRLADAGIRILKVGLVFPLDTVVVREFAEGLEEILVVEDKRAFLETFVKDALYGTANAPRVVGKFEEDGQILLPASGELASDAIARALAKRIGRKAPLESADARIAYLDRRAVKAPPPLQAVRSAYFCSGCPHNRSLVVPQGSVVGAGIGCHVLAMYMSRPTYGTLTGVTQMGAEGAQFIGLSPFTDTPHFYQNLGDGTFAHSGSLAVRAAVAAGINVTYKLLYNSAVAMTGGQTVIGGQTVQDIVRLLQAEGVKRIIVTTEDPDRYPPSTLPADVPVMHRDRLVEAEKLLAEIKGVTVLVNDQQCAAEKRRLRKRGRMEELAKSVFINERVCEGCGDCGQKSNCLSVQPVETEFGRKTQIHQSSCNKDYSCLLGDCPSFATIVATEPAAKAERRIPMLDVTLPDPTPAVPEDNFSVLMTGIGGTGVVTVNQVLATAAVLDGKTVRALDQLGSSQKAGPVVSHLRIFSGQKEASSVVPTGGADLFLVFDALVGSDPLHLSKADPERTLAVVSTTKVPTGRMVADPTVNYPDMSLIHGRLNELTRRDRSVWIDAQQISERLFGDHMASNLLLVGAAWQSGALPLSRESIEAAIRLNGVSVELNLAAFEWGRASVAVPDRLEAEVAEPRDLRPASAALAPEIRQIIDAVGAPAAVNALLEVRVPELVAYQDLDYARDYLDLVGRVVRAEQRTRPGEYRLSEAVARNLYKLMAYKDEYEVARLLLEDSERARIAARFGKGAKVTWHLHPSFLRRLGVKDKVTLGAWFTPALRLLRSMKWVRRRTWDPFGRDRVRKVERALARDYRALVDRLCEVGPKHYDLAIEAAGLPDMVRGYEDVKLESVKRYMGRLQALSERMGLAPTAEPLLAALTPPPPPVAERKAA